MRITIPNRHLATTITLLDSMPLKAAQSRARTKLLTLIKDAHVRFAEDEYALVAEYANLDDAGTPVIEKGGTFALQDPTKTTEFLTAREELFASEAEVAGATYTNHLADVKTLLDNYDGELSGESADAYDVIYDAITTALDTEGGEQP